MVNKKDIEGETPVSRAANEGHYELCNLLLIEYDAKLETSVLNKHGSGLVSTAAAAGDFKTVLFLVDKGVDFSGSIYDACRGGDVKIVDYLISKGAHVNCDGNLSISIELHHMKVFHSLINGGADIELVSKVGSELNMYICFKTHNSRSIHLI